MCQDHEITEDDKCGLCKLTVINVARSDSAMLLLIHAEN